MSGEQVGHDLDVEGLAYRDLVGEVADHDPTSVAGGVPGHG
jgi:hypothetical protein